MSDLEQTTGRRTATDKRQHVRLTVDFFTNPGKLANVGDPLERAAALCLHGACIGISARQGGDGHVILDEALAETALPVEIGKILLADGVLHQADHGCLRCPQPRRGHVYVHDFLEHNRTAAEENGLTEKRRRAALASHKARRLNRGPLELPSGEPPVKRGPGRPRKHPLPTPALQGELLPALKPGPATQVAIPVHESDQVLQHPAETRARKRGRPRNAAPREYAQEVHDLCGRLADWVARNDPDGKRPTVGERWLNSCRLMIEVDGREPEKIAIAIDWCQRDEFWRGNILSMHKLREKYVRLQHDAKRGRGVRRAAPGAPPAAVVVPGMNSLYGSGSPGLTRSGAH